jgi:uncharacterized membrane protein YeaQ/YmgE (transglycosylase-associated protein family)
MFDNILFLAMEDTGAFIMIQFITAVFGAVVVINIKNIFKRRGKIISPSLLFTIAALIQILSTYFLGAFVGSQSKWMLEQKQVICKSIANSQFDAKNRYCFIDITVDGKPAKARLENYFMEKNNAE